MKNDILHYPRLDTVIMVEETIRKLKYYPTKTELWKALPKKVMYQTFSMILDYLINLNKIIIGKDGRIVWVWNPELIKKITGFSGKISWDKTKPDGMPRKLLDVSKINKLGWRHQISLEEGIRSTYEWYEKSLKFKV